MPRRDPQTQDLFAWEPPEITVGYGDDVAGRGSTDNKIARVLSRALRDARDDRNLSRQDVAAAMSRELGRTISPDTLDKWTSEGSVQHRIPLDAFIALITAIGGDDLLGFIPRLFGFEVVQRKYAGLIELQLLEEHERDVAAHKAKLQAKLRAAR